MNWDDRNEWPWINNSLLKTKDDILLDRQTRMNIPAVRARAQEILTETEAWEIDRCLRWIKKEIEAGNEDGIAFELAALHLLKPLSQWGQEITG